MKPSHDALLAIVAEEHDRQHNVGCAVTIRQDGDVLDRIEIGDACISPRRPMRTQTRGQIASVTKPITAAAALKAAELGLLDLDAPIQRYVPEFASRPEGEITIDLLADHRAGVRHYGAEWTPELVATHFASPLDALRLFKDDALVLRPDSEYKYSNYGYVLIAAAIERATKKPFAEALTTLVYAPLGLTATGDPDVARDACTYSTYDPFTFAPLGELRPVKPLDWSHARGAGDLVSTADDMAAFGEAVVIGDFLSAVGKARLEMPGGRSGGGRYGWQRSGPWRYATGSLPGAQAALFVSPKHRAVISVLANAWGQGSESGALCLVMPETLGAAIGIDPSEPAS